jgi:hypothetical protein
MKRDAFTTRVFPNSMFVAQGAIETWWRGQQFTVTPEKTFSIPS